jgi:hypothetical protein
MIATLAYHPIRLKNFSQLELGKSFLREDDRWLIVLRRNETKAKRPDMRAVEDLLQRAIAFYLTWARPRLMRGLDDPTIGTDAPDRSSVADSRFSGPLWIGQYGKQLSYSSIDKRIRETTLATLGVALSAHDFRRCAAVTARFHAGSEPHLASGLLQHVHPQLVDENYNLASSMAAARRFGDIITDLQEDTLEPAEPPVRRISGPMRPTGPDLFSLVQLQDAQQRAEEVSDPHSNQIAHSE